MLKFKSPLPVCSLLVKALLVFVQNRACTSTPHLKNFCLVDYLTGSLKFPKNKAIAVSSSFGYINSPEKPEAVVHFFRSLGLSDKQIQSSIQREPSILFADVEKVHKPKVAFFQELGIDGPHLGVIISKNPCLLKCSLEKKLKPSLGVIIEALELDVSKNSNNNNNNISHLMFHILSRTHRTIGKESRLRSSIVYLRSCGVVGSSLIMLLKSELGLFSLNESKLKLLVSRATKMGFVMGSRMLAYGIWALYGNSAETINRKFELIQSFGFSRDECYRAFVKTPAVFKTSEAKLRCAIEFFLRTLMLDKSVIICSPQLLMFSMEKRVIPRYKVLEMIKSMSLLEKEPNFVTVLHLSEKMFVEKFILRFADDSKGLKIAYENHLLESWKG